MAEALPADCAQKYRAVRRIASGGFGAVYEAEHIELGSRAAIKVLLASALEEPAAVSRFGDEARLTASLAHPRIIRVLDHGAACGIPWIAFEYAEGRSVRAILEAGPVPFPTAIAIVTQVAEALEEAHARGVLHRDIKPDNVLEVSADAYKVVDFGIAKWASAAVQTAHGLILGTPAYIAPEQIRGDPASPASDLYSLGVMFFELATGQPPFAGTNPGALLDNHLHRAPPRATQLAPGLPPAVDRVFDRLLAKEPERRYASARDLIGDLAALKTGTPIRATGRVTRPRASGTVVVPAPAPRRAPFALAAAGAIGVVLLAALWPRALPAPVPSATATVSEAEITAATKLLETSLTRLDERNAERRRDYDHHMTWQLELSMPNEPTPEWLGHLESSLRVVDGLRLQVDQDLSEMAELAQRFRKVCATEAGNPYRQSKLVTLFSLRFRVECQSQRYRHHLSTVQVGLKARRRPGVVANSVAARNPVEFVAGAEALGELLEQVDTTCAHLAEMAVPPGNVAAGLLWDLNAAGKEFSGVRKELSATARLDAIEARWLAGLPARGHELAQLYREYWQTRCGRVQGGHRIFMKPAEPRVVAVRAWVQKLYDETKESRAGLEMILDALKH